jgi:hypothetical protein
MTKQELLERIFNDEFATGFIETALWSSTDDEGEPLDDTYSIDDFTKASLEQLLATANDFESANEDLLEKAYEATGKNARQAGYDFWLTKEGHGAGFWDGDWGDYGDRLDDLSTPYGEDYIYVYRGKLHL